VVAESLEEDVQSDVEFLDVPQAPRPFFTVDPCVLVRLAEDTPPSRIAVSGELTVEFARYLLENRCDEDLMIDTITVEQAYANLVSGLSDNADFDHLQFTLSTDRLRLEDSPASMLDTPWALEEGAYVLPAQSVSKASLYGSMATVLSSAASGNSWRGAARSGHAPTLQLGDLTFEAGGGARIAQETPSPMILRRTQIIFTPLAVSTTMLVGGVDMEFAKFQMTPVGNEASWRQIAFFVEKSVDLSLEAEMLSVYRGATRLDTAQYTIDLDEDGSGGMITLTLTQEEVVSGSGAVYTMRGFVNGVSSGATLVVGFQGDLVTDTTIASAADAGSNFVWSDRSEEPHTLDSIDWFDGLLIEESGWSQLFVAP